MSIAKVVKTGAADASLLDALNSVVLDAVIANSNTKPDTFTRTSVKFIKKAKASEIIGTVELTLSRGKETP